MSRNIENTGFICEACGLRVQPLSNGSFRNHCPRCLYSKHVDIMPGDRQSRCKGLMRPIDLLVNSKKGYLIAHKCESCEQIKVNKIAVNTVQQDDFNALIKLSIN